MKITKHILIVAASVSLCNYVVAQDSDFKPSGNLYGYAFGDYANKAHNDTLQRGGGAVQYRGTTPLASNNAQSSTNNQAVNTQTNAFQMRRVYLGYDYKFAPNMTAQVLLANEQNFDGGGKNTMYVKYANVKCSNIFKLKNTDFVFGQYQTCSFANSGNTEPLWSYRSIERTLLDLHSIDGSTDLGVSLQGKAWSQQAPDSVKPIFIGYALQVGNNNNAVPNTNNFKKVRMNVFVSAMQQKLTLGLYGDYLQQQIAPYKTTNMTTKVYASYATSKFRLGFELFRQTNLNSDISKAYDSGKPAAGAVNDTSTGVQMGWSVFASAGIVKNKLSVFGRYDMYNPDTKYNSNNVYTKAYSAITGSNLNSATFYTQAFYTVGLDWTPNSRFHIMPNIWYNGYKTMMSNSLPGGTAATDFSDRVKMDHDLVYRVTFYFIFNGNKKVSNNGMSN